jgi:hypothetical protein
MRGRKNLWPRFGRIFTKGEVTFPHFFFPVTDYIQKFRIIFKQKCAQNLVIQRASFSLKSPRGAGLLFLVAEFRAGLAGKFRQELATLLWIRLLGRHFEELEAAGGPLFRRRGGQGALVQDPHRFHLRVIRVQHWPMDTDILKILFSGYSRKIHQGTICT